MSQHTPPFRMPRDVRCYRRVRAQHEAGRAPMARAIFLAAMPPASRPTRARQVTLAPRRLHQDAKGADFARAARKPPRALADTFFSLYYAAILMLLEQLTSLRFTMSSGSRDEADKHDMPTPWAPAASTRRYICRRLSFHRERPMTIERPLSPHYHHAFCDGWSRFLLERLASPLACMMRLASLKTKWLVNMASNNDDYDRRDLEFAARDAECRRKVFCASLMEK